MSVFLFLFKKRDVGVLAVKGIPEDRAVLLAEYIIENNATVRKAANNSVFQNPPYIRI